MASKLDGKGFLWALFFLVVLVALYDILSTESVIANFLSGGQPQPEGRVERAVRRAVER